MTITVSESTPQTKVARIINLALKDAGILGEGETASAETILDSFDTFKMMVGQWQIDGLMVYATDEISFAPTGAQSYTIGNGGAVEATRPSEVIAAFWRDGSTDRRLEVLTSFEDYQRITSKSDTGTPEAAYYDPDYTLGTLYVWPQASSGSIYLTVRSPLPTYTATTDELSVPGEYELALRYGLAELLPAMFQLPVRPDIAGLAKRARALLKRNNVRIPSLDMPAALIGRSYSIGRGQ